MTLIPQFNPSSNPGVEDFRRYVENPHGNHIHNGVDGGGETRQFICLTGLTNYWSAERITKVLGLKDVSPSNDHLLAKIKGSYLQVFSILSFLGYPSVILDFIVHDLVSDRHLPLPQLTSFDGYREQTSIHSKQFWSSFYQAQWRFTPKVFGDRMHRGELAVDEILPIWSRERLQVTTGMTDTRIYKVTLHGCCNRLPLNEVVFKTFNARLTPRLSNLWEIEASAYAKIFRQTQTLRSGRLHSGKGTGASHCPEGVVKCFGSFRQGTTLDTQCKAGPQSYTHFIILEYTPGGTLTDFARNTASVISSLKREDWWDIWNQVFYILEGLQEVHDANLTHQDIKPSNILDTGTSLGSTKKARFRIGDLGTAVDRDKQPDSRASGSFINWNYAAPECVGGSAFANLPPPAPFTGAADIWALGCVFSEMFIRFQLGNEGVKEYTSLRKQEILSKARLPRTNYERGYHDGVRRLSCVDEMHRRALEGCQQDSIVHLVSQIILDMMLQPIETRQRVSAGEIRAAWLEGLEKLEKMRHGVARSQLVVVRRAAPSRAQRHKVPECFSKAISICPSSFMVQSMSPSARWEFSGQLRWPLDHQTRVGLVSISLSATISSLLTDTISQDYWEGRNNNFIGNQNLTVTSSAPLAPARQPQRKSLNRHLENVLLMALLWLGYLLMNGESPAVTRARCPFTRDKVNIKEGGQSADVCPWKGGLHVGCIFVTQPRRKVPGRIRGRL